MTRTLEMSMQTEDKGGEYRETSAAGEAEHRTGCIKRYEEE